MAKTIPASTIAHVQNAPGLTASQRASLKQSPAEKKARIASAQSRMGAPVSNFAKRLRGEKTPTGVGRPASGSRMFPGRKASTGAGGAAAKVGALLGGSGSGRSGVVSQALKRKPTRGGSRSSGR